MDEGSCSARGFCVAPSNRKQSGSKVAPALTGANARVPEKPFGQRVEIFRLPDQTLVLRIGATEGVLRRGTAGSHTSDAYYHD